MTAADYLIRHPEIAHGAIRIGFTPDEEIGLGTAHFDVARFGAFCAYTLDGGSRGEVESESFSADAMTVTFHGFNTHPGYAKGRLVNAIKVAAAFINRLPADSLSPETTDGHDGFVHPYTLTAGVERTVGQVHRARLPHTGSAGQGAAARGPGPGHCGRASGRHGSRSRSKSSIAT